MSEDPEETGVPEDIAVTPEREAEIRTAMEKGAEAAEVLKRQGRRAQREMPEGIRTFINPTEPNCRYLVKAGVPVIVPNPQAPLGLKAMSQRDGDVWAEFRSGVCVTEDLEVIEWCEAHGPSEKAHEAWHKARGTKTNTCNVGTGRCRDINDPLCAAWAEFKSQQVPKANQDATISPSLDIDALLERGTAQAAALHQGEALAQAGRNTQTTRRRRSGG